MLSYNKVGNVVRGINENTFVYQAEKPVIKLLQITDPHLFKDESAELLG